MIIKRWVFGTLPEQKHFIGILLPSHKSKNGRLKRLKELFGWLPVIGIFILIIQCKIRTDNYCFVFSHNIWNFPWQFSTLLVCLCGDPIILKGTFNHFELSSQLQKLLTKEAVNSDNTKIGELQINFASRLQSSVIDFYGTFFDDLEKSYDEIVKALLSGNITRSSLLGQERE